MKNYNKLSTFTNQSTNAKNSISLLPALNDNALVTSKF